MAKRLVICCDGTWNTLGQPHPTNVAKLKEAVAATDSDGTPQVAFHGDGVGTGAGLWDHLTGGAFGAGLSAKVQAAYRFVVDHYEPGDELFFFGFSRGAFTARSTVGFIRNCGVLRPANAGLVDEAYRLYRDRDTSATGPESPAAKEFRRTYAHEDRTPIRFIGVWDTVGALGIPLSGGRLLNLLNRRWQFHDTQLSSIVQSAFQALAVDEHRPSFEPAVWQPSEAGREREQVWFAGDHSDVGGGHPVSDLSDLALRWMTDRAHRCGLDFEPGAFAGLYPGNPLGELHDSPSRWFRLFGSVVRGIGTVDPQSEFAASTSVDRHQTMQPPYRPGNLVAYLAAHHTMTV
ncbi:DUF2235 domain-containing protein [Amycolatopsis vancoresmycina]|uniref:T6SS Phospholipase effector Tle1-like catalytic domain-containing protein n=1 Tax=Amycolatopsis vancoresmycina DSM 44592 TaxID=1292037 RepID=R1HX56_9PSEU|nr:DUF2235 domain-containing protein [Amycolatopsis vancoresmycina]EOD68130.1 hypothetical protein H480_13034 [Amycolatopsis vancoresmycina DSM 44592]